MRHLKTYANVSLTALLLVCGGSLSAQQASSSPRALVVTAENEMASDARHQAAVAQGGQASAVLPGDVLHYRLRFTNVKQGAVKGVVFTNPIPHGLRYLGGSAAADRTDVTIDYSIDGGRSYSPRPLMVEVVQGRRMERPAPPEQYSHVRWTVRGSISPGASVTADFRATMPSSEHRDSSSH